MAKLEEIFRNNDHILTIDEVKDDDTGLFINDATVTVTLHEDDNDELGAEVNGQSWPTDMIFIASSNGKYEATLDEGIAIIPGTFYIALITVTKATLKAVWEFKLQGMRRRATSE